MKHIITILAVLLLAGCDSSNSTTANSTSETSSSTSGNPAGSWTTTNPPYSPNPVTGATIQPSNPEIPANPASAASTMNGNPPSVAP